MKKTKRKGFNFFRSYYDVFNELSDEDKLAFIEALLDKQFLGINPTDLKGLAKFAWISQVNSIDSQVKGYEDKTGVKLTPTVGGGERVENTHAEQVQVEVEEKGKGKEKEQDVYFTHESFLIWFKQCRNYLGLKFNVKKLSTLEKQLFNELKEYTKEDFKIAFKNFSNDKYWNDPTKSLLMPKHFLNYEHFTKYLNAEVKTELTLGQKLMGRVQ